MICDVSKWQESIDWEKLAPNLDFCIIKASSGKGKDPYYDRNAEACKRLGIPFHAYHFCYCTTVEESKNEAKIFAESTKGTKPIFYVLDVESQSKVPKSNGKQIIETFESELRNLLGKDIRIGVYIGHELYNQYGLDYQRYSYVWIPRHGSNKGTVESSIVPSHPCDLWQYTSKGKLPGIKGDVDLDILMKTKPLDFFINPDGEKQQEVINNESVSVDISKEPEGPTGKKLAEYCLKVYDAKWVYWYGTFGNKCTQSLYNSKKAQYKNHYTSDRTSGYMRDIENAKTCADCVGMIKSYFWTGGVFGSTPKYATNHCPDVSANDMLSLCSKTGDISSIPNEPGIVVWRSGHIGVYVGDGYTVEMKGFDYDCVKKKVKDGTWKKWGRLPSSMISYTNESIAKDDDKDEGLRILKNGSKGNDVKQLQTNLIKLGYSCGRWGIDGDFGDATELALVAFQNGHELEPTGIYDSETITALEMAIEAFNEPVKTPMKVKIFGGNCYIRSAPNTSGKKLGVAKNGEIYSYAGKTSDNGWNLIFVNGTQVWVSGKYSKLID